MANRQHRRTTDPRAVPTLGCRGKSRFYSGKRYLNWTSTTSAGQANHPREHRLARQAIADANGGNRAAGTPGYDASVAGTFVAGAAFVRCRRRRSHGRRTRSR